MVHGLNKAYGDTWGSTHLGNTLHEKYPKSRIITCNYMSDDPRISPFTMDGLRSNAMEILNDLIDYCKRGEMDDVRKVSLLWDVRVLIIMLRLGWSPSYSLHHTWHRWYCCKTGIFPWPSLSGNFWQRVGSLDSFSGLWKIQECAGFNPSFGTVVLNCPTARLLTLNSDLFWLSPSCIDTPEPGWYGCKSRLFHKPNPSCSCASQHSILDQSYSWNQWILRSHEPAISAWGYQHIFGGNRSIPAGTRKCYQRIGISLIESFYTNLCRYLTNSAQPLVSPLKNASVMPNPTAT